MNDDVKTGLRTGLLRSAIVLSFSAAIVAVLVSARGSVRDILHWFDFLSAMPGLSGVVILVLGLMMFLLLLFVAHWVFAGFAGPSGPSRARMDSQDACR